MMQNSLRKIEQVRTIRATSNLDQEVGAARAVENQNGKHKNGANM